MGFNILFALALTATLAHAAPETARDAPPPMPKEEDGQPIPGYDCSDYRIGNHNHPTECTKFISCNHGGFAYEMDCAKCPDGDPRCPEGRTNYNYDADQCLWPPEAGCSGGGKPTTTTTTQPPPTTTTEADVEDPPIDDEDLPVGSPCDPDNCKLKGWCHTYKYCKRPWDSHKGAGKGKIGTVVEGYCKEEHNLYFNPNKTEHGGICDFWSGLTRDMKRAYNNDPNCIDPHCEWNRDPDKKYCAGTYQYFHPDRYEGQRVILSCPDELLWSQKEKNCQHPSDVLDQDGNPCCPDEAEK